MLQKKMITYKLSFFKAWMLLMLSFFVFISPLFSFSWKRDTLVFLPVLPKPQHPAKNTIEVIISYNYK